MTGSECCHQRAWFSGKMHVRDKKRQNHWNPTEIIGFICIGRRAIASTSLPSEPSEHPDLPPGDNHLGYHRNRACYNGIPFPWSTYEQYRKQRRITLSDVTQQCSFSQETAWMEDWTWVTRKEFLYFSCTCFLPLLQKIVTWHKVKMFTYHYNNGWALASQSEWNCSALILAFFLWQRLSQDICN